ncbi:RdgB/HAM1 family non-canonical purine NTP pyrophosphatase [Candidatus Nomurabacteria bacterium]|nr:RdgB/HAM1 family non-canonical purine NTP pyrophosphatase [Candidatus Nomurabacteria bacterium]
MKKILLATTNEGKLREINSFFKDLPFELITLADLNEPPEPPDEKYDDIMYNAQLKAHYYGEATGMPTISEDSGFYIDALDGWPGVHSARVAQSDQEKCELVVGKLEGIANRGAQFRCVLFFYDPHSRISHSAFGSDHGIITKQYDSGVKGFAYDPIFFSGELGKTYAQATLQEKASVSGRGKALAKMKNILSMMYTSRHTIVPVALIIKGGELMMTLRNDPQNPRFHKKWEFPGGKLDMDETIEECVIRETREETGYDIEVIARLSQVMLVHESTRNYQVCLIPCLGKVVGGDGTYSDAEVLEIKYFGLDDVLSQPDLIPENDVLYKRILPELKALVEAHNL